ncbi:hypothetical protein H4219_001763 [Mycoemilia scoparia]|uniref:RRM domain-containing protein n=1 Tax=Mycoemilia scoparia TaxID=417184 RepID=A0A9W7ZZB0_9FUNG|nr:hypothetical protein H4219_001763 [Mycoemilia scoparia]
MTIQINPSIREALVKFEDPVSASIAVYLSGTILADHAIIITLNSSSAAQVGGILLSSGSSVHSLPFSPLATQGYQNVQNGSAHTLPLANQEVVAMMESRPRKREEIPPSVAANIHPSILQFDPAKAEEISRTIYVGNIASTVSAQQLMDFFSQAGPVAYVKMAGDGMQPTRFSFIEFADIASSQAALKMSGAMLADRPLKVNHSKNAINKPPRPLGYVPTSTPTAKIQIAATNETEVAKQLREVQAKIISKYAKTPSESDSPSRRRRHSRSPSRSPDRRHRSRSSRRRYHSPERSSSRHSSRRYSSRNDSRYREGRSSRRYHDDDYDYRRSRGHERSSRRRSRSKGN